MITTIIDIINIFWIILIVQNLVSINLIMIFLTIRISALPQSTSGIVTATESTIATGLNLCISAVNISAVCFCCRAFPSSHSLNPINIHAVDAQIRYV